MLTKKDKEMLLDALKMVDVKKMEIENNDKRLIKWFRFGSYNGMMIASEIIKNFPEKVAKKIQEKTKVS